MVKEKMNTGPYDGRGKMRNRTERMDKELEEDGSEDKGNNS